MLRKLFVTKHRK